jgi:S-adenosyl-L-methionine hydrolase (adenosine-forming)
VARAIVFLSDFGLEDEFVGTCHGVIARLTPDARVIDLSHGVPPGDVLRGALLLRDCIPYVPADAILLGVVDPGVGGARLPLAVRTAAGRLLVGPDNGVLSLAWAAAGGPQSAVRIEADEVVLRPTSRTFHGRDVFAPAAARLSEEGALSALGAPVSPASLVTVGVPRAEVAQHRVSARVLSVDRFGNVALAATADDLRAAGIDRSALVEVRTPERVARAAPGSTFGDVEPGMLVVLIDSAGWVAVGRNGGSAADLLAASPGATVQLRATASHAVTEERPPGSAGT